MNSTSKHTQQLRLNCTSHMHAFLCIERDKQATQLWLEPEGRKNLNQNHRDWESSVSNFQDIGGAVRGRCSPKSLCLCTREDSTSRKNQKRGATC